MDRWSQNWQMLFNPKRCSVLRMGKRNPDILYDMRGKVLKVSEEDRLGSDYAQEYKAVKTIC